jgi:hypothetical protein
MSKVTLLERQQRMAMRDKLIKQDICPNCKLKLREKLHGGMYCPRCDWEK